MNAQAIPAWTPEGLLPPIGTDPAGPDRSTYRVPTCDHAAAARLATRIAPCS